MKVFAAYLLLFWHSALAQEKSILFRIWKRAEYLHYSLVDKKTAQHFVDRQIQAGAELSWEDLSAKNLTKPQTKPNETSSINNQAESKPKSHVIRLHTDDSGQYFYFVLEMGPNRTRQSLIVDTGSDLIAVPCGDNLKVGKHSGRHPEPGQAVECGPDCAGGFCAQNKCVFHRVGTSQPAIQRRQHYPWRDGEK